MTALHRPAVVTSARPAPCTGQIGKRCSCGLWHAPGGMRVEKGIQSDHVELPISFAGDEPKDGMLTNPGFWVAALVSAIPTVSLLVWWLR